MKNYTRDYVNIDSLGKTAKKGFSLKKTLVIIGLSAGIGGAIFSAANGKQKDSNIATEQASSSKVFKSYVVKSGDTLTSIVRKVMSEYPETAKFYTEKELIKEVVRLNNLQENGNYIIPGYITIPYYIPNVILDERSDDYEKEKEFYEKNREAAVILKDYEQYVVESGDSYWKIACKYTDDNNEIVRLVKQIQELNDNRNLLIGKTITIPNIEKYQLLHAKYKKTYEIPTVVVDVREKKEETSIIQQEYEQYVVQSGDSYWKIASKYTDDNIEITRLVAEIQNLNGYQDLLVGATITIPDIEKYQSQYAHYEKKEETSTNLEGYDKYVVQSGDSYWKIASMYTDDNYEIIRLTKEIKNLNGNQDLLAGATITIPNIEKYQSQHAQYEEDTKSR